ncbi:MAG: putative DNA binding domain-containing protein [Flavobacteriales bacterium]|nr:putative DNA binding domain-containing protein [Flavobacteriales bacterium]
MEENELKIILTTLINLPSENELVEFKEVKNNYDFRKIGKYFSALSNEANLLNQDYAWLIFGIEDKTRQIVGTNYRSTNLNNLKKEIADKITNQITFIEIHQIYIDNKRVIMFQIPSSPKGIPIAFEGHYYARNHESLVPLSIDKIEKIRSVNIKCFEEQIAKHDISNAEVFKYLSTETYFDLLNLPYPSDQSSVIEKFISEKILVIKNNKLSITNLGALLLAKRLEDFDTVFRKTIRVIIYKGKSKVETIREQIGGKGYALGFDGLVDFINSQLPANEEIEKALRKEVTMYPTLAIRELVANALIHQDFEVKGFPMVEIYQDRIEISNSGTPLIKPDRFIDGYESRNERLSDIMRRMYICEEIGSGIDKVIFNVELYQLPAIKFQVVNSRTSIIMYSYKQLNDMDRDDKIRACYQHACLKYVSNEKMTNQTLRERFNIEEKNLSIASRIIADTIEAGLIKIENPESNSKKHRSYIPYWL